MDPFPPINFRGARSPCLASSSPRPQPDLTININAGYPIQNSLFTLQSRIFILIFGLEFGALRAAPGHNSGDLIKPASRGKTQNTSSSPPQPQPPIMSTEVSATRLYLGNLPRNGEYFRVFCDCGYDLAEKSLRRSQIWLDKA